MRTLIAVVVIALSQAQGDNIILEDRDTGEVAATIEDGTNSIKIGGKNYEIRREISPAELEAKKTIIPKVQYSECELRLALDHLRNLTPEEPLDSIDYPKFNLVVYDKELNDLKFSITAEDVPISDLLKAIAELIGAELSYDGHLIEFRRGMAARP